MLGATAFVLVFVVWEAADLWRYFTSRGEVGQDWRFYASLGRRWLDTGVLYGDRQVTGLPYHVLVNVDNLYPPTAVLGFAPFAILPAVVSAALWWGIPVAITALAVVRMRPSAWTWPVMALCVFWPRTIGSVIVGNSDLASMGMVAGGILWGWPGALGFFKPSVAPFAFAGARRRSWWLALGLGAALSVPFLLDGAWGQYLTAAANWDLPWDRAILNVPMLMIPVVAWFGRQSQSLSSTGLSKGAE
jgi:hypothetical protein